MLKNWLFFIYSTLECNITNKSYQNIEYTARFNTTVTFRTETLQN